MKKKKIMRNNLRTLARNSELNKQFKNKLLRTDKRERKPISHWFKVLIGWATRRINLTKNQIHDCGDVCGPIRLKGER